MARKIVFEGKTYTFPDDATDAEISEALASAARAGAGAPGLSETPESQRPQMLRFKNLWAGTSLMPEGGESEVEFPSQASMLEVLPGAAAAGGGMLAGPPGAAVGGGSGEIARQVIRKYLGLAPATGNIQKWTGMDPTGLPAAVTGTVAEAATAGLGEAAINKLAASKFPDWLREKALNVFGGMFPAKGEVAKQEMIDAIRPIAEELPVGSRTGIQRAAAEASKKSGKAVGDIYNVDVPANFQPVVDRLRDLSAKQVRRGAHDVVTGFDPVTGKPIIESIPADIKNPKLMKELEKRAEAMALAERAGRTSGAPTTVKDLFEARKAADEMAQARAFEFGKAAKEFDPKTRALKSEREAIKEQLHDPAVWSGSAAPQAVPPVGPLKPTQVGPQLPVMGQVTPSGAAAAEAAKTADAVHAAWKTVETGTKGQATGSFVERWVLARFLPGLYGTAAGAVAAKPAFWRSVGSKALRDAAKYIETGNDAEAFRILNTAVNDYEGANKVQ